MRVLHVIDSLGLGGTQNLLLRVNQELRRRGVSSRVCVLSGGDRTHETYRSLAPTHLDFAGDYRRPLAVRSCVRRLRDVLDDQQPDIVHSYLWTSDFVTALASRRTPACHVSQIVDRRSWLQSPRWIHALRRIATRRAFRQAGTRFLAVSEAARAYAVEHLRLPASRTSVAYNGIDWSDFELIGRSSGIADRPLLLGTAGRLEQEKGHRFLIDAVRRLVERGCDVRLEITGEGAVRSELESQVASLGVGDHVTFVGWVSDVRAFYRRVDVFVVPSVNAEGLPTTILEAMASACVVVASDVGGAAEAVEHGVTGMLVPPADVARLTESIHRIYSDPAGCEALTTAARARIKEQFTTEKMVDTIVQTYLEETHIGSRR